MRGLISPVLLGVGLELLFFGLLFGLAALERGLPEAPEPDVTSDEPRTLGTIAPNHLDHRVGDVAERPEAA